MAHNPAEVFASHLDVMEALHQNFAGNDDAQKLSQVDKLQEDLTNDCQQKEDDVKATIAGKLLSESENKLGPFGLGLL